MTNEQKIKDFFDKHPEVKKMYDSFPTDYQALFLKGIVSGVDIAGPLITQIGKIANGVKK